MVLGRKHHLMQEPQVQKALKMLQDQQLVLQYNHYRAADGKLDSENNRISAADA